MLAPIFLLAVCLAGNVLADDDLVVGIDKMVPFGNSGLGTEVKRVKGSVIFYCIPNENEREGETRADRV